MGKRRTDEKRRREIIVRLNKLAEALPGSLVSAQIRSKPSGKEGSAPYGRFWMLTWKEKGKTRSVYVRLGELSRVHSGVRQMKQIRELTRRLGELNVKILLAGRKER